MRRALQAMLNLDSTRCAKGAAIRAPPCSRCVAHHLGKPFAPSVCMLRSGFRRETCAFFQRFLFRNMWMRNRHAAGVLHTWCRDMRAAARALCVLPVSVSVFERVRVIFHVDLQKVGTCRHRVAGVCQLFQIPAVVSCAPSVEDQPGAVESVAWKASALSNSLQ